MKKLIFSTLLLLSVYIASAQVDSLQEYTGKYKFAEGSPVSTAVISIQNNMLYVDAEAGASPMTKISADVFSVDAFNGVCTFLRNTDKKVVGCKVEVEDMILEGTKTDPAKLQDCFVYGNEVYTFSRN